MPENEFSKKQGEAQAEKNAKISKGTIIAGYAKAIHPVEISEYCSMKNIPKFPNDLRFVKMGSQLKYVRHLGDGVLQPIGLEEAASAFACSLGHLCIDYGSKDFMEMAKLAKLSAYMYEDDAKRKCESLSAQFLPLIIEENDIVPVRELTEPGWCWKRLDFDADPWCDPGAWLDEVKPRIKTNWESFCAFIGSLFDPQSNRERYVWMYGGGESGKSTICEALIRVFGDAACSRDAKKINDRWFIASIHGKRLVIMSEAKATTVNSGTWKSLTGDEYHEAEQKGQPIITVRIDAKMIVVSNDYPDIASGAENSRRIILVETERPDGWVATNENTKAKTMQRLQEGWPWFLHYCKSAYEKNKRLVPEHMETVYDLQGEDENEEAFRGNFVADPNATCTYKEITAALPGWERWKLRKFITHCIKEHGLTRGRNESQKFFKGMRKKTFYDG